MVLSAPKGTALLACLAVAVLAPDSDALQRGRKSKQKKNAPRYAEAFLGDLDQARKLARDTNDLICIMVIQEGEEGNDRHRGIYLSKAFAAAAQDWITILVNDGDHPARTIVEEIDGEKVERQICSVYRTPKCSDHKRSWNRVYQEFNEEGEMKTPHSLVVGPDGKLFRRFRDECSLSQIVSAAGGARETFGPSITKEQLLDVRRQLDIGRTMARARVWVEAYKAWAALLAITEHGIFAEEAKLGAEAALVGMREDIGHAVALMEGGDVERGYEQLIELRDVLKDSPLGKESDKAVKDAERNKAWKPIIKFWKKKREAVAAWNEILDLLAKDEERKAERLAAKLLRKYGDTPVAEEARKRFPDLVEPDGDSGEALVEPVGDSGEALVEPVGDSGEALVPARTRFSAARSA